MAIYMRSSRPSSKTSNLKYTRFNLVCTWKNKYYCLGYVWYGCTWYTGACLCSASWSFKKKTKQSRSKKGKEDATMTSVSLRENPEETRSNAKSKALFECVLICNACRNTQKPRRPRTWRTSPVKRNESSTGRRSSNASSFGSCVQPSIGMPFANSIESSLVRFCVYSMI